MSIVKLSLLELNREVKKIVKENTERFYWIIAEISGLKVNYSGHCYLELVQKDEDSDKVIAQSRATIWAPNFRMIKPYFETTTGQPLVEGLSVLVRVSVEFHELYGLSLNITDIEPDYTVGELAVRRQKIIARLTEEGVIGMNQELELATPCRKIAIISSSTAAGYGDFCDQLVNNVYGYKFYIKLFPAQMQGAGAEQSIIDAMDKIYGHESFFDAVVIIRGGGSQADLSCFNSYWLSYNITQFPLPVFTGIGHEQDDSVADMVAHTRLKTPTAVAAFLIENMSCLDEQLEEISTALFSNTRDHLMQIRENLDLITHQFYGVTKDAVQNEKRNIDRSFYKLSRYSTAGLVNKKNTLSRSIKKLGRISSSDISEKKYTLLLNHELIRQLTKHSLSDKKQELLNFSERINYLDPKHVLGRGYSITLANGKVVRDAKKVTEDEVIETILEKGKLKSTVVKK